MKEATWEFVSEMECNNTFIEELSEHCGMLLQDLCEDYFENIPDKDKMFKIQGEWNRICNFVRIVEKLNWMIQKHCTDTTEAIEKFFTESKDCKQ